MPVWCCFCHPSWLALPTKAYNAEESKHLKLGLLRCDSKCNELEKTTRENTMGDMREAVVAVIATFQALSWVSMGLRLYVRWFLVKRRLGWDDGTLPSAFITLGRLLGC
jgi:hypothetical protein